MFLAGNMTSGGVESVFLAVIEAKTPRLQKNGCRIFGNHSAIENIASS
jgi:hypothetical protein